MRRIVASETVQPATELPAAEPVLTEDGAATD